MMIPNPIRLTKIVRKMMNSGRVTDVRHSIYNLRIMTCSELDRIRSNRVGCRQIAAACVLAVIAVHSSGASQEPTSVRPRREPTMRPEIIGTHGIVAAGRHYSVAAGVRILQQGGNAIDAGVASVFAAAVVEISHFGLGGESPAVIYDAKRGDVIVINGQGPAPKDSRPELFRAQGKIDANGPLAATIPAVVDAMALALDARGTMRLEQVLQPAIEYADGFPMYAFLRDFLIRERAATEKYEWSRRTYYPDGRVPEVGEMFRQPNLARTLRAVASADKAAFDSTHDRAAAIRAGRDAFYTGDIARRIADADRAAGGVFSYDDLAAYHGSIEKPATTSFHGFDVYKAGPWDQGPVLLQTLNLLEDVDLRKLGHNSASYIHVVHEAIKLAYDDRNAFYGDPTFAKVPLAGLLSKKYASERFALIGRDAFLDHRPGDPYRYDPSLQPQPVRYMPHS